jgi:hypothetical protein
MAVRRRGPDFLAMGLSALRAVQPAVLHPPGRFRVLMSVRDRVDARTIVWLEGLGQLKNPLISSIRFNKF